MSKIGIVIVAGIVFIFTGVVAYVIESVIFRYRGIIGRYEGLFEYYKKIDQKKGNIAAAVWAVLWIVLLAVSALVIYLIY